MRLGMVNQVVKRGELKQVAEELAAELIRLPRKAATSKTKHFNRAASSSDRGSIDVPSDSQSCIAPE